MGELGVRRGRDARRPYYKLRTNFTYMRRRLLLACAHYAPAILCWCCVAQPISAITPRKPLFLQSFPQTTSRFLFLRIDSLTTPFSSIFSLPLSLSLLLSRPLLSLFACPPFPFHRITAFTFIRFSSHLCPSSSPERTLYDPHKYMSRENYESPFSLCTSVYQHIEITQSPCIRIFIYQAIQEGDGMTKI